MKLRITVVFGILLTTEVCIPVAHADVEKTARPGMVNYVEGQASVGKQSLNAMSVGNVEVKSGQSLNTKAGKAEILLTPGVFVRLGDMSSAKMISPNLLDTEIELIQGEALVEVAEIHKENRLRIVEGGKVTDLTKTGLYDFDADRNQVRVFDGRAVIEDAGRLIRVKGGHQVDLRDEERIKAKKFDKKLAEDEDLYRWTSLRSSYLAEANANVAGNYVDGGFGWFGDGWYWDPWFDAFTFIPGDGIFYSPFGWGFYSPGFVYAAPIFYGGTYYRHFGPNYHVWGPGAHYGLPSNYGSDVHYGSRTGPTTSSGRMMGVYGPGFPSGGFHSMGGFHGGVHIRR